MCTLYSTEIQPVPTMDMIKSQFHLPATFSSSDGAPSIQLQHQSTAGDVNILHLEDDKAMPSKSSHTGAACDNGDDDYNIMVADLGPDLRQLAEESLEEERRGQLNQLGSRVQERWNTYRELLGSQGRTGLGIEESHD